MSTTSLSKSQESGYSIIEFLVSVLLLSLVLAAGMRQMLDTTRRSYDHQLMAQTDERARILLDLIAYDLRMAGAGMPIGQNNFVISDASLGDAPLPITVASDAEVVSLRANLRGRRTVVSISYTPSLIDNDIDVFSVDGFTVGDTVYLSNITLGEEDGMMGVISSISGNTISLDSGYVYPAGAVFDQGSTLEKVNNVTYDGSDFATGVIRQDETTTTFLLPNSSLVIDYLDQAGGSIAIPLIDTVVASSMTAARVTVGVQSEERLKDGDFYVSQASQVVAFRNVILNRN